MRVFKRKQTLHAVPPTSTPVRTSWGRIPLGTRNSWPRRGGWNGSSWPASI